MQKRGLAGKNTAKPAYSEYNWWMCCTK